MCNYFLGGILAVIESTINLILLSYSGTKIFLNLKEAANLLNISQQQIYKIIRDMNKKLAEYAFLVIRVEINKKYFFEQIYKAKKIQ